MEDISKIDKGYNKKVTKKTQKTNKAVTLESKKNSLSVKGGLFSNVPLLQDAFLRRFF